MRNIFSGLGGLAMGRPAGLARMPSSFGHLLLGLVVLLAASLLAALFWPRPAAGVSPVILWALGGFVCAVLVPLAVLAGFAKLWGQPGTYQRTTIAVLWLWTVITLVLSVLPAVLGFGVKFGQTVSGAGNAPFNLGLGVFYLLIFAYVLWLNGFLLRHGLGVSVIKATIILLVLATTALSVDGLRYMTMEPPMMVTIFKN